MYEIITIDYEKIEELESKLNKKLEAGLKCVTLLQKYSTEEVNPWVMYHAQFLFEKI